MIWSSGISVACVEILQSFRSTIRFKSSVCRMIDLVILIKMCQYLSAVMCCVLHCEPKCYWPKWTLTTFLSRMLSFLKIAPVAYFGCCVYIIQKRLCVCPPLTFLKCNASGVLVSAHTSRQGGRGFATCT